jgi:TonB family protein
MIFTGNANPVLASEIARHTGTTLGSANVGRFSDGEVTVEITQNVRARDVFVIQSTCAPTNENLMELIIMVDALKRASAERISAVIPYFGYARQDRRPRSSRVPITAKVVANMLQAVGVSRVLTMDLHADQIQGFFDIPVDNIYASPVLLGDLRQKSYPDYLNNRPPPYPALSKRLGEQGKVVVRVFIDTDGNATQAEIRTSSGYDRLDQTALKTAQAWKYVPGKVNGEPKAMWFNVPINFVLE